MAKREVGRPTKYKKTYAKMAKKICSIWPAIDSELAEFFEVDEDTIYEWKKVHPEFSESIKWGKAVQDGLVEKKLFERAVGYNFTQEKITHLGDRVQIEQHVIPDVTAQKFWLNNRRADRWQDKSSTELTGKNGAPIQPVINLTLNPEKFDE